MNRMLNSIWAAMILIGIVYALLTGNIEIITEAALDGAGEALSLGITMAAVVAFWMGMMEIAKDSGLIQELTQMVKPFLKFLFPRIPDDHPSMEYMSANIIANVLGLGWAATPTGLKAMDALADLEAQRGNKTYKDEAGVRIASNEMCIFLILNISSLQLIPVNIIAYRSQYGSAQPGAIIGPAIVATMVSTLAAVIFCKAADRRR